MASIYDKLAQAKYEEKLKATILTLTKGVCGELEPPGTTWDVVTGLVDSDDKINMVAWVISYCGDADRGLKLHSLLESKQCASIEDAYQSLMRALRVLMTGHIGTAERGYLRLAEDIEGG